MNNFNPLGLLQMLKGKSPKDIVINIVKNKMGGTNPIVNNLINMAEQGDKTGIEAFARNLFKERGLNFDEQFRQFMSNFKN